MPGLESGSDSDVSELGPHPAPGKQLPTRGTPYPVASPDFRETAAALADGRAEEPVEAPLERASSSSTGYSWEGHEFYARTIPGLPANAKVAAISAATEAALTQAGRQDQAAPVKAYMANNFSEEQAAFVISMPRCSERRLAVGRGVPTRFGPAGSSEAGG